MKSGYFFTRQLVLALFLCAVVSTYGQNTAFTYQGKLTDGASAANGQYDLTFKLFAGLTGGTQIGGDVLRDDVQVTAGIFTVTLDFGSSPFTTSGANYLEIWVRPGAQTGAYTTLSPRQPINSSPYAVRSLNATSSDSVSAACVFCITNGQIASVDANRVNGTLGALNGGTGIGGSYPFAGTYLRSTGSGWAASGISVNDIPGGSTNYVQNTTSPQSFSNFNISGTGTANIFNAATQYNLGGGRILGNPGTQNLFAGINAGQSNTGGTQNSFFGQGSGTSNTTGGANSFFGQGSGFFNNGNDNSFFGNSAGQANTSGSDNSFFGLSSGFNNTTGGSNSFFGHAAGATNTIGSNNTTLGSFANVSVNNLDHATAIGADSVVSTSNTLVLGRPGDAVQIPGGLSVTGTFTGTVSNATNATQLGGVAANQFVQTGDARLSDSRTPTAGSANYIQNTTSQQATSNFNVSGNGTAGGTLNGNIVNATTQYNIGGSQILGNAGTRNLFAGNSAGGANTTGTDNLFIGWSAGPANVSGIRNSFVGTLAGDFNNAGDDNSFVGWAAGQTNLNGFKNSYFGSGAGQNSGNTNNNAFFGWEAGQANQLGSTNSFFGAHAGISNTSGNGNTLIGYHANVFAPFSGFNPTNATAIGANAFVSQDNSLVLGSINGINGATADTNVGIGTSAPLSRLHLNGNSGNFALTFTNSANTAGRRGYRLAFDSDRFSFQSADDAGNFAANHMVIDQATGNVGIGISAPTATFTIKVGGTTLADAWTTRSSVRFKSNIQTIPSALNKLMQLRGVTFDYLDTQKHSIGFVAEEVGRVLPEIVDYEVNGRDAKGMDYSRVIPLVVEAIKEQQRAMEDQELKDKQQQQQIEKQQVVIDQLKQIVCAIKPDALVCKEKIK